jgi:hypothetical protein
VGAQLGFPFRFPPELGARQRDCRKKKHNKGKDGDKGGSNPNVNTLNATSNNISSAAWYCTHELSVWMIDTGSSHHVTLFREDFTEYHALPSPGHITFGDNRSSMPYIGTGLICGTTRVNSQTVLRV